MSSNHAYRISDVIANVDSRRVARKHYLGTIRIDFTNGQGPGEPAWDCNHHHHSRGSARDCAKSARMEVRRAAEALGVSTFLNEV